MNIKVPARKLGEILKECSEKLSHLDPIEILSAGIMLGRNLTNSETIIEDITRISSLSNKLELNSTKKAILCVETALSNIIKEMNENPFKSNRGPYCSKLRKRMDKLTRKSAQRCVEDRPKILKKVVHSEIEASQQPSAWAKHTDYIKNKKRRSYIQTRSLARSNCPSPKRREALTRRDDTPYKTIGHSDPALIDLETKEDSCYTYSPEIDVKFDIETQECNSESDDDLCCNICNKSLTDKKFQNTGCYHSFHGDCIRISIQQLKICPKLSSKCPVRGCKYQICLKLKRTIIEMIKSFKKDCNEFLSSVNDKINILWCQKCKYIFSLKKENKCLKCTQCNNLCDYLKYCLNKTNTYELKNKNNEELKKLNKIQCESYQSCVNQLERCISCRKWKQSIAKCEKLRCKCNNGDLTKE